MKLNDKVKCVLVSNIVVEGIVEDITDYSFSIRSKDGLYIINNPERNLILTKIFTQDISLEKAIDNGFKESLDYKTVNLAELKLEANKLEKDIIKEKLKSHDIQAAKVTYGKPDFFKK